MSEENTSNRAPYEFYGKMPLKQAIPLGLQHVLAMFVGNLTPLLIICGACGISGSEEFAHLQVSLLQNAMFVAGVVTLVQLYAIGPIGGKVPIIMGTSSGFIGVFKSVADTMGGGVATYGAIMGASIIGGLFEGVLGAFIKPLRKFFPPVVTGTVVLSIGLSLISVGVNSFGGGSSAKSAAGAVRTDRNPHGETLDERSCEQLCNPHRDHCRICGSGYYGTAPSEFRDYCGWSRIYKSMGIKLE